jgi:lipoxygenase
LKTASIDVNLGFPLFSSIDDLFNEGFDLPPHNQKGLRSVLPRLVRFVQDASNDILRFETPATMDSKI